MLIFDKPVKASEGTMIATSATEKDGLNALWKVRKCGKIICWIMTENKRFYTNYDLHLAAGYTAMDMCELKLM